MEYERRAKGKQDKPKIRVRAAKMRINPINFDHHILGFRTVSWAGAETYSKRPRHNHSQMAWLREQLDEPRPDNFSSDSDALGAEDVMSSEEFEQLRLMFGKKRKEEDDLSEQLMFYNHMHISKMLRDVNIDPKHLNIQEFMQGMFKGVGEWGIKKYLRDLKNVEYLRELTERN